MTTRARTTVALLLFSGLLSAQFIPPSTSTTFSSGGTSPVSVVAGEFNTSSAIPGFAVANNASNNVTLFFGMPEGNFTAQPALPSITSPGGIAAADFNKDNNLDLAVVSQVDNSVTIFLLDGTGHLKYPAESYPTGSSPFAIAVADFNGDGNPDLAIANRKSNNVTVLQGDGTGGFTQFANSPFAVGNGPSSIAVGDFNNDTFLDLAITNELDNTVTVLLGQGNGMFKAAPGNPFPVGFHPSAIVAGDFNGDGNLDFAVANSGSNNVMLFLGNGQGGFGQAPASPFATGTDPVAMVVRDLNGDGFLDLAVANFMSGTVTVLLGSGKGNFSPGAGTPFVSGGVDPISLAAADFNQDGVPDLAIANNGSADVTIALNSTIPMPTMVSTASYTSPVALGSLVTIFGSDLPTTPDLASPSPPSTCLDGVSVTITDSSGATSKFLNLVYAGQGQINAILPPSAATGPATFTISTNCGTGSTAALETGSLMLDSVAPGLFSVNSEGMGVASAEYYSDIFVTAAAVPVYTCTNSGSCKAGAVDVSSGTAVLVLNGTGIRNRAMLSSVTVSIGTQTMLPVFYAGPGQGAGVDQVNLLIPSSLAGSGVVNVSVSVGTMISNQVTICLANAGNSPPICP